MEKELRQKVYDHGSPSGQQEKQRLSLLFQFKQDHEDRCGEQKHHPDATEAGDEYNYGITSRGRVRMNKLEQGNVPV